MKNKKLWLVLVLTFITGALFGQMVAFQYTGNLTEQQFSERGGMLNQLMQGLNGVWVDKLPNTIIQAINYALDDYAFAVSDVFIAEYIYSGARYAISLRITDTRNKRWQFHAYTVYF